MRGARAELSYFQLRSELRGEVELVPEPADVGPGGAGAAGVFGAVLDRAEEEFELVAELRDAGGCPRRGSVESFERLVQPTAQVLVEVAGGLHVFLGRAECVFSLCPVEVERRYLAVEQLGVTFKAAGDELDRALEPLFGDRVELEFAAGKNEGAGPDPIGEPSVGALEEERVRRQRRPARRLRPRGPRR